MNENGEKNRFNVISAPNLLTLEPTDCLVNEIAECTFNIRDLCVSALKREKISTTVDMMELSVNLFFKEMGYQMSNGYSVKVTYFIASTIMKGIFDRSDGSKELLCDAKHAGLFQFIQKEVMREFVSDILIPCLELKITFDKT